MKKIILAFSILLISGLAHAQIFTVDTVPKQYKNIIGLDATMLLRQFLDLSPNEYYGQSHIISYRHAGKGGAFRLNAGGYYRSGAGVSNNTLQSKQGSFDLGIGFERYSSLTKRWNLFFGADVISNYILNIFHSGWASPGQIERSESYGFGIAPLLGLAFKINPRFSVSTETSYDVMYRIARGSLKYGSASHFSVYSTNTGLEAGLNPVMGISFRIHF